MTLRTASHHPPPGRPFQASSARRSDDRRIEGEGTEESRWRNWPVLATLPVADPLAGAGADTRLVVVAPHPDDELLACGGLIARALAQGVRVRVLAVTEGEASHAGAPQWHPLALAERRAAESRVGLERLGRGAVRPAERLSLGLDDGRVELQEDALVLALCAQLQPGDRVVTTWQHDGHPDHEATGRATARVCRAMGCALWQAPVWMWHWAVPDDARVPWALLRRAPLDAAEWARKQQALAAHASQWNPRGPHLPPVLGERVRERAFRVEEHFFVAPFVGEGPAGRAGPLDA